MLEYLISPKTFFESCAGREPSLKVPALIILVMALLYAISGYMIGELTGRLLSGFMEGMAFFTAISVAVGSFFAPWIMWIIAVVVLMIMIRVQKGSSSFKRVAEISGYGMVPLVIGAVISLALSLYYLPGIKVTPIKVADPEQIQVLMTNFMNNPVMQEYTLISTFVTIILLLWTANICAIGLEKCCSLSVKQSLIAVGVPVVVYILYSLYTLGMAYGWI